MSYLNSGTRNVYCSLNIFSIISFLLYFSVTIIPVHADEDGARGILEEIIVTAQKREQSLQDVPISITAMAGEKLESLNIHDIRDLRAQAPNVNVESSFGKAFPRFYIRGLGVDDFAINLVMPVAIYNDEVVLQSPILQGTPAFDLERVEILRGPQGTLWGKNTTGGAIHLISNKPEHEFGGYGRVTYGRFDQIEAEGAIGGSLINDVLAARAAFIYQGRDGWITNTFTGGKLEGYDDVAGRVQFLWTPNSDFDALLNVHFRDLDADSSTFHLDLENTAIKETVAHDQPNLLVEDQIGVSLNMHYDFAGMTLTSITAYEEGDWDSLYDVDGGTPFARLHYQSKVNDINQFSQEVRLASNNEGALNWIIGAHYFQDELDTFSSLNFNPFFSERVDSVAESESIAVLGNVTYDFNDRLTFNGGIRWTHETRDFTQTDVAYGPGADIFDPASAGSIFFFPGTAAGTFDDTYEELTWDVSLSYALSEDMTVYGKIARGFRGGNFNGLATTPAPITSVDPEIITSYEGGVKGTLAEGRLRFSATGFYYDYEDNQFFQTSVGVAFLKILLNAPGGSVYGAEFEFEFAPTENLYLQAGLGYIETEFKGSLIIQDPFDVNVAVDINGNEFVRAPEVTTNILARYSTPFNNYGSVYIQTDWVYTDDVFHSPTNDPRLRAPSYWQGGVRAGFISANDKWEVAGWARNITDSDSFSNMFQINGVVGGVFEGGPRTFGVDFITRF